VVLLYNEYSERYYITPLFIKICISVPGTCSYCCLLQMFLKLCSISLVMTEEVLTCRLKHLLPIFFQKKNLQLLTIYLMYKETFCFFVF
jgi:hypothetical protein